MCEINVLKVQSQVLLQSPLSLGDRFNRDSSGRNHYQIENKRR